MYDIVLKQHSHTHFFLWGVGVVVSVLLTPRSRVVRFHRYSDDRLAIMYRSRLEYVLSLCIIGLQGHGLAQNAKLPHLHPCSFPAKQWYM